MSKGRPSIGETPAPSASCPRWEAPAVILLIGLALLVPRIPIAVDLPQHLSQIRVWQDVQGGLTDSSTYSISWFRPDTAIYPLLAAGWRLFGPEAGGRVVVALLMALSAASLFWLADYRGRPPASAIIACACLYNVSLAWGLLNFMTGLPVFGLWWAVAVAPITGRRVMGLVTLSAVLLWCHPLWFAFACFALVALVAVERPSMPRAFTKLVTMLPVGLVSLWWIAGLGALRAEWGFPVQSGRSVPWFIRPAPQAWGRAAAYLSGWVWAVLLLALILWLVLAVRTARKEGKAFVDVPLLSTALVALFLYAVAPDAYLNTIFFSWRWAPVGLIFLILALPLPRLPGSWASGFAAAVLVTTATWTAVSWQRVNQYELTGLEQAIDAVPERSRLLGLPFVKRSEYVPGSPFLQMAAWATVLRGAETDFSFAEHGHGLVRYRERREVPWTRTPTLDADAMTEEDYRYFDFALVNLAEEDHAAYQATAPVEPVTTEGRWRLYRVIQP